MNNHSHSDTYTQLYSTVIFVYCAQNPSACVEVAFWKQACSWLCLETHQLMHLSP